MKIGIDISQVVYEGFGIATYTRKLVETLLQIDNENKYTLFFSSLRRNLKSEFKGAKVIKFKIPPTILDILWNTLHQIPVEIFIGDTDIFHSSNWIQPPSRAKKVTTIHDMLIYKFPETIHPKIMSTQKRHLEWVKKECDLIISDSESTKEDIINFLGIPKEKIRVVYLAPGEEFKITQAEERIGEVKKKYGISDEYLLTVGSREPRKNLSRIIQAFNEIKKKENISLIIAGNFRWGEKTMDSFGIKTIGFVNQADLPALYAGAKLFVYPSLYEGFGLPILEAQSTGCPVLTSDKGSLKEIVGDTATIVNPEDSLSIQKGIEEILSLDKKNLEKMKFKGKRNAQLFTWEKTAQKTLCVYKELL
jgi:glycosyltransferase involved in cell wall biosynthesis